MKKAAPPLNWLDSTHVSYRGRRLVYLAGCDYYRLSWHPKVRQAARAALRQDGLNTAASRITTGNHRLYEALEKELAGFFQVEAAVLTSSGYAAALVAAQAWRGCFSSALIDAKAHACLRDACRLGECPARPFPHRDPGAFEKMARAHRPPGRLLVLTDALFAHNGTLAPLREYLQVLPRGALLMVDEAHSAGVLGGHGRGVVELLGLENAGLLRTTTLSKAFGAYGGVVLCDQAFKQRIVESSHYFSGNTPLPLPLAAAARAAIRLLKSDPSHRQRLQANIRYFHSQYQNRGAASDSPASSAPIVAVSAATESRRLKLHSRLIRAGIFPSYIRYPSGSRRGFFRFALSSEHTRDQLDRLAEALG